MPNRTLQHNLIAEEAFGLVTDPWGTVWPPRARQPLPDTDTRTIALRRFRQFLSLLRFRRAGKENCPPIEFRVPIENIHIEQPDDVVDLKFPAIAIVAGKGVSEPIGLGPPKVLEPTYNVFGQGTVLVQQGEYSEAFIVEVWGSQRAERRALIAGISAALRSSSDSYSVRMALPEYYGCIASFWLDGQQHIDDPDVVRGRRRGQLLVGMCVPEVELINAVQLHPSVTVTECGPEVQLDIPITDDES